MFQFLDLAWFSEVKDLHLAKIRKDKSHGGLHPHMIGMTTPSKSTESDLCCVALVEEKKVVK